MGTRNFVRELHNIQNNAYDAIVELFKQKGITELDISNKEDEYDDVFVYRFKEGVSNEIPKHIKTELVVTFKECYDGGDESVNDFSYQKIK